MKKLLIGLFMIGAAFTFAACNSTAEEVAVDFESDNQVFAIEALSAASLLDYSNYQVISYVPLSEVTTSETTTEETTTGDEDIVIDDQIDEIDKYMEMMDTFLGENDSLSVQVLASDKEEWQNLISFTTVNIAGEEVVFYLYYNETLFVSEDDTTTTEEPVTTETPTTEAPTTEEPTTEETTDLAVTSGDQEHNFYFEDEDDNEVVYLMTGLIVSDGIEYNVEGKRIVEDNGDEILRLRSFVDTENYVTVSYKLDAEDNKQKFFFEVVTDGVVISSSKVKVIEEDGDLKVFLDLESNGDSATYVFKIIVEDDVTIYQIKYDIHLADGTTESGFIHIVATIDPETGETIYTYKVLDPNSPDKGPHTYRFEVEKRHEERSQRDSHASGHGQL